MSVDQIKELETRVNNLLTHYDFAVKRKDHECSIKIISELDTILDKLNTINKNDIVPTH